MPIAKFLGKAQNDCYVCGGLRDKIDSAFDGIDITAKLRALHHINGKEYNQMLQSICELNSFKSMPKYPGVFWTENDLDPDIDNLRSAAKKAVSFGNEVYILPNPKGVRTPDFIFKSKGVYKDYDLKTITGQGSAGTRMLDSIGQTRRVLLNIAVDYNPRKLAKEIKKYFEINDDAIEVVIYKGKRNIVVTRFSSKSKQFVVNFMKQWK